MKWLFAVLVALNIIVFGGMVAGRVAEKQKTVIAPTVPMVSGTQELSAPAAAYQRVEETAASSPDWVHGEAAAEVLLPEDEAAAEPAKSYRVLLPSGGDAIAQMDSLAAKGFTGSLHDGEISVGVVRSKSAAQVLMSRLAGAGFGGAWVSEQQEAPSRRSDSSLSISRMQVLFMAVDDKDAQAIQAVVGKYGRLNRNACR